MCWYSTVEIVSPRSVWQVAGVIKHHMCIIISETLIV